MAEEYEESEVVFFQENPEENDCNSQSSVGDFTSKKGMRRREMTMDTSSENYTIPVRIPENAALRNSSRRCGEAELDGGDGEMVPPHVITGRRVGGEMMAFSVCTGNGRTLKGRDLSQVRNSVLRMTGFLET